MESPRLAIGIIFVDWNGVLCDNPFWHTVIRNPNHPCAQGILSLRRRLFCDGNLVEAWMRGEVDTVKLIGEKSAEIKMGGNAKEGYPVRKLVADCVSTEINVRLLDAVSGFRDALVDAVIATDNMDVAIQAISRNKNLQGKVDDIISSSSRGVLKSESIERFFAPYIASRGLGFENTMLIDDNDAICAAFENAGGKSFCWAKERSRKLIPQITSYASQLAGVS